MPRHSLLAMMMTLVLAAAAPQAVTAQETSPSGGGSLKDPPMPRGNVRGGALAARAPGLRIKDGIARHVDKNKKAFFDFGGASISQSSEEANAGLKDAFIEAFLDSFLEALDEFVQAVELLLQANALQASAGQ